MYIQLNGQILQYEKYGEGSPLILLHGNGESHEIFEELAAELAKNHTVYALDSRGQGGSATPKSFHFADMAQDVVNFIESLSIEKPTLIGFSDGGIIALLVAMKHSELLASIVVCGANLTPNGLTGSARREIKKEYKKTSSPLVKMMLKEPNICDWELQKISVPALVCAGSNDMVKPKETRAIAGSIPNAKLHILPNETHASYIIHSDKLAPIIADFLNE